MLFNRKHSIKLLLSITSALYSSLSIAAPSYNLNLIDSMGTWKYANIVAINDAGQIAANIGDKAIVWSSQGSQNLNTLGGLASVAHGMNNLGQVAGYSYATGNFSLPPTVWYDSTPTALVTLGGLWSEAYGINDNGQIVGMSYLTGNYDWRATIWENGTPRDLGTLTGTRSEARDINNNGQVTGFSYVYGNSDQHATFWNGSEIIDLGTLPLSQNSIAVAINDSAQIVGNSYGNSYGYGGYLVHATLWSEGTINDLGTLGGDISYAKDINNSGQIVGTSTLIGNTESHATLWMDGAMVDLNSVLDDSAIKSGWVLIEASSINNKGWIAGYASNTITGESLPFLLTPVPEASSYSLMMLGLSGLFIAARRKTKS